MYKPSIIIETKKTNLRVVCRRAYTLEYVKGIPLSSDRHQSDRVLVQVVRQYKE